MPEPLAIIARLARCKRPRARASASWHGWPVFFIASIALHNASDEVPLPARASVMQGGPDTMRRFTSAMLALSVLPIVFAHARPAAAQYTSSSAYGTTGVQAPSLSAQAIPAAIPPGEMALPQVNVPAAAANQFERNPVLSIPSEFVRQ